MGQRVWEAATAMGVEESEMKGKEGKRRTDTFISTDEEPSTSPSTTHPHDSLKP